MDGKIEGKIKMQQCKLIILFCAYIQTNTAKNIGHGSGYGHQCSNLGE